MKETSTPVELAAFVAKRIKLAKILQDIPSQEILTELFNVLFYTSLRTEEGQFIKVTVTLYNEQFEILQKGANKRHDDCKYYPFNVPILLTEKNLTKLSKAADPWSSSLAVYFDDENKLFIRGMIDQAIHYQSFLNFERADKPTQPGILQVMVSGVGMLSVIFDFEQIATLNRSTLTKKYSDALNSGPVANFIADHTSTMKQWIIDHLKREKLKAEDWEYAIEDLYVQSLSRILLKIQGYGHGGTLLITNDLKTDLKTKYEISYNRLEMAMLHLLKASILHNSVTDDLQQSENNGDEHIPMEDYQDYASSLSDLEEAQNELKGAIRFIASLSCVDGLILLSERLNVKGFGTIITRKTLPTEVYVSETGVARANLKSQVPTHFGTRHQSLFAYCLAHPDSLGFVVSQDGELRAVMCVNGQLVIWENIKIHQFLRSKKLVRPMLRPIN
jgi:hypothetical protein